MSIVIFSQCEKDIPDPKVSIPDQNFLNALIERGVDINGDEKIIKAEAEEITYLSVVNYNISDMTGIEAFINLDTLYCIEINTTNSPNVYFTTDCSK